MGAFVVIRACLHPQTLQSCRLWLYAPGYRAEALKIRRFLDPQVELGITLKTVGFWMPR